MFDTTTFAETNTPGGDAVMNLVEVFNKLRAADALLGDCYQLLILPGAGDGAHQTAGDILKWRVDGSYWGVDSLTKLLSTYKTKISNLEAKLAAAQTILDEPAGAVPNPVSKLWRIREALK